MVSEDKYKFIQEYNKPIIWNLSCFGNIQQMYYLDVLLELVRRSGNINPIQTIHGSYSSKFNGGREALYKDSKTNIKYKIKEYNKLGIGIKLTFSNMNIHKEQFEDSEMRWYLDLLNETKGIGNGIICVNDDFAELVKKNYPDLDLVASHVKMELETKMGETDTVDYYNSKFDLYDIVVMNTYRAFDDDFLSKITHPEKVEFIVNHSCSVNCPMAKYHHELIDKQQSIKWKYNNDLNSFKKDPEFIKNKKEINKILKKCEEIKIANSDKIEDIKNNIIRFQSINKDEINHLLDLGINRFKIEGRDFGLFDFLLVLRTYVFNDDSMLNYLFPKKMINTLDISILKSKLVGA